MLETMIAMVILASALLLMAQSWSSGFARVKKSQQVFEMSSLLERKMIEVDLEYRGKPLDEIPEESPTDDFGKDFPDYSWKITSKKLEFPDLTDVLVGQEGGANEQLISMIKQMTDYFSKSIKEVTVTVIYAPENKKTTIEQSITTYFVNYEKELSLGLPSGGGG